jgi:isoquinoline 1-oxidoreductase alpha subunit
LRDTLNLTGTKYGCGKGICGSCMVHVDGRAVHSCLKSVGQVSGKTVTTIGGLSEDGSHPLQQAWLASYVPQCGYCQGGHDYEWRIDLQQPSFERRACKNGSFD